MCTRYAQLTQKICNEFNNLQEIITDSVESAVERARVLVEYLAAETSKEQTSGGIAGFSSISTKNLEEGFSAIFKKTEEYLFIVSECKHRITNFFGWLYKASKKYESRREETPDQQEPNKEDAYLLNLEVNRPLLLKHLKSEDCFMIRYLAPYFKPGNLPMADIESFELDYLSKGRPFVNYRLPDQDHQDLTTVRAQTEQLVVGILDQFVQNLAGKSYVPPANTQRLQEERRDFQLASFKTMQKLLNEELARLRCRYSGCMSKNMQVQATTAVNTIDIGRHINLFSASHGDGSLMVYTCQQAGSNYIIVLSVHQLAALTTSCNACVLETDVLPSDFCVTHSNKLVCSFRSEAEHTSLHCIDLGALDWQDVQVQASLQETVARMIESGATCRYSPEKTKSIVQASYGLLHSNAKGLLCTSNGNNIIIIDID